MRGQIEPLERRTLLSVSLLADLNTTTAGAWASTLVEVDSVGYFLARDAEHGRELWRTDGTAAGTWMVKDIDSGPGSSIISSLHASGGLLYFAAKDDSGIYNIWRSDGTADGTIRLTDAVSAADQVGLTSAVELSGITILSSYHRGVWRSDGTPDGTIQFAELTVSGVARLGDHVYFLGRPISGGPVALWKSDGSEAGTTLVRQFSSPWGTTIFQANGRIYFWADDVAINGGFERAHAPSHAGVTGPSIFLRIALPPADPELAAATRSAHS